MVESFARLQVACSAQSIDQLTYRCICVARFRGRSSDDTLFDPALGKVALYAKSDLWQHASRQLPDGKWASKLGPDEDIEHDTPECLCGDSYGTIRCIMRKARK